MKKKDPQKDWDNGKEPKPGRDSAGGREPRAPRKRIRIRQDQDQPKFENRRPYGDNQERRTYDRNANRDGDRSAQGKRTPYNRDDRNKRPYNREDNREERGERRYGQNRRPYNREERGERNERPFGERRERPNRRPNDRNSRHDRDNRDNRTFGRNREESPRNERRRPYDRDQRQERSGRFATRRDDGEQRRDSRPDDRKKNFRRDPENKLNYLKDRHKRREMDIRPKAKAPEYDEKKLREIERNKGIQHGSEIRLNKYIANAGLCSRREADRFIAAGEIKVNGKVVTEMGHKVTHRDEIKWNGKILNGEKKVYVLLNKPKDFITTMDDPQNRRTVMELVAKACEERIYPVGRLDRNTTGLLLLTNDGDLADKLAHPGNKVRKVYQAMLNKPLEEEHFEAIKAGFKLEDGDVEVDDLAIVTPDRLDVGIELHIGRNRIVRRIFEHFGYEVVKLDRVLYGGLTKKDLPRGRWRFLTEKELIRLKYFI
ncbi:pseudouridine synthase [Fulvitalea axinellae]|uniref:Pseudouridine synthase n=1 Tax=Fulvitalea axinellae TaxID=1182444 RepID=A0AAU9CGI7_9BACT|nr:pseudouridine synthase [Fulvitalea axinellae]